MQLFSWLCSLFKIVRFSVTKTVEGISFTVVGIIGLVVGIIVSVVGAIKIVVGDFVIFVHLVLSFSLIQKESWQIKHSFVFLSQ